MKAKRLSLALALLLLALAPQPAKASPAVWVMEEMRLTTLNNGETKTFSKSGGGSEDLDGGYGAVIEAYVAPAAGVSSYVVTDHSEASAYVDTVDYSVTVKVFFINPSTGLGSWSDWQSASGSTYMEDTARFNLHQGSGSIPWRTYPYSKAHSWTLPSSGDYPAKVRVTFSFSKVSGYMSVKLAADSSATVAAGAFGEAIRRSGTGTTLPLAQLSVSSTPISVTVSYSGTVSGSASTPFTLYGVDKDLTVTRALELRVPTAHSTAATLDGRVKLEISQAGGKAVLARKE